MTGKRWPRHETHVCPLKRVGWPLENGHVWHAPAPAGSKPVRLACVGLPTKQHHQAGHHYTCLQRYLVAAKVGKGIV